MNRTFAVWVAVALSMSMCAQKEDPVVMRINNKDVTRSEFEYSYNKNNSEQALDRKTLDEYVQLFVDFKLKVAAAEEMQLDTLLSFKKELKGYRDQQAEEYLVDTAFIESEARKVYASTKERIGDEGLVLTSHILLRIPQDVDNVTQEKITARMDSICGALRNGADFGELATRFSEDPGSASQGGKLPWIFAKQVYPEYSRVAYSLKLNEVSEPFLSPAGLHVVKLLDKKQLEPYEFHRKNIHDFLVSRGVRKKAMEVKADSLYKQYGGKIRREDVLAHEDSLLDTRYPEFGHLMQEYYDGLLLFEVSNRCVWEKATRDEAGLEAFYKKNKKKYTWDAPRYKGAVVHCANPETAARVKKEMKKLSENQWREYIQKGVNQDTLKSAYMEMGLFKIGDNVNIDHLVFKQGEGKPLEKYPYAVVVGKVQKRPDSYKDVRGPLIADYQNMLETEWLKELRKKFKWKVYEDVLRTVNNH